jgi:hypothetical protein
VHACWHEAHVNRLSGMLPDARLSYGLLADAVVDPRWSGQPSPLFESVEVLLKGIEVKLPEGVAFRDKDGIERDNTRVRWWDPHARTLGAAALANDLPQHVYGWALDDGVLPASTSRKPTFFGHYWMRGTPTLLGHDCVCVDYSAGKGGPLTAYRFTPGEPLRQDRFVWVD